MLVIYSAINSFNRYVSSVTTIWLTWPSNDDTIVAAAAAADVATDNTTVAQYVTEKRVAAPTVHVVMPGTHTLNLAVSWLLSRCV